MMVSAHAALVAAVDTGSAIVTRDGDARRWLLASGYAVHTHDLTLLPTAKGRRYAARHAAWARGDLDAHHEFEAPPHPPCAPASGQGTTADQRFDTSTECGAPVPSRTGMDSSDGRQSRTHTLPAAPVSGG